MPRTHPLLDPRGLVPPALRALPGPAWAVRRAARQLDRWAEESALGARRNAMVAATALTQRRAEAREVEDYLDELAGRAVLAAEDHAADAGSEAHTARR